MKKDKLFRKDSCSIKKFEFDNATAQCFDDMLQRSVPFYSEIQRMIVEITEDHMRPNTNVYDIGCSTGITLWNLLKGNKKVCNRIKYIGIDNSLAMLNKANERLARWVKSNKCRLILADVDRNIVIRNASVVILSLLLQFVRPSMKASILSRICCGLKKKGCLILVEKLKICDHEINEKFTKYYYRYKMRNDYSMLEIYNKELALKNVLIPNTYANNLQILQKAGFKKIEGFFRWYNFSAMIAIKD